MDHADSETKQQARPARRWRRSPAAWRARWSRRPSFPRFLPWS